MSDNNLDNNSENIIKKKGFTFKRFLLIYVAVWLLITVVVCVVLYQKTAGYQKNYEEAFANSNPDLTASKELSRFSKDMFLETYGREVIGVNCFETDESVNEYVDSVYYTDELRYVRASQYSDSHPVYDIYVGRTNIGAMTLKQAAGLDNYGFHSFEFNEAAFYVPGPTTEGYYIKAYNTDTVSINGVLFNTDDSFVNVISDKTLEKQLHKEASELTGVNKEEVIYYVTGFINRPSVTFERDGVIYEAQVVGEIDNIISLTDEECDNDDNYFNLCHYFNPEFDNVLEAKLYNGFFAASQAYVLNLNKYGEYSDISKYLDKSGPGYKKVTGIQKEMKWEGKPEQFAITEAEITDIVYYNENTVIVNTHHAIYNVYKGDIYNDNINIQWLYKCENGKWYIYDFAYI